MTIGIIGAMEEEVELLKNSMPSVEEIVIGGAKFYVGEVAGKEVVLLESGIGKVNAALGTTLMADRFKPEVIINTGSAGGMAEGLAVGDVIISDRLAYGDVDVTEFGYTYGQVPRMPAFYQGDAVLLKKAETIYREYFAASENKAVYGLVVTNDSFIMRPDQHETIRTFFPDVKAVEMEAVAIAQVAYQFDIPFLIIRAISDLANQEATISFDEFIHLAAKQSATCIIELLKTI
ncbi:5'-methylthioadenosine/adenosylhomocysteine nucleosidase [Listeria monocytogenes]|nr:5'-methylthioadenosine/adenosylhomocysteine nucleosidase [Listeria monocytogenes]